MIHPDKKIYIYSIWIIILSVYVILRLNIIDIPLDRDEGNFGYTGQVILDGGIPYRDVFDHKPPVTFYLYAIGLLFFPPTPSGIHIFFHLYNFFTLITLFFLGTVYSKDAKTGFWMAFVFGVFSSIPTIQGFTASSEMFMLLPVALSGLFAVLAIRKGRWIFFLVSGVLGAIACWTKQSGIFINVFIALYIGISNLNRCLQGRQPFQNLIRVLSVWLLGFLGISLLITLYFLYKGVMDEFIYWTFIHGYHYSKAVNTDFSLIGYRLADIVKGNAALGIMILVFLIYGLPKKISSAWFASGLLFFSLISTLPGYAYPHYFAQIAPAIAITGGFAIAFMVEKIKFRWQKAVFIVIVSLLIVGLPVSTHRNYYFNKSADAFSRHFFGDNPFPESLEVAAYIKRQTENDSTVLIAGSEPQILLYSQRKSATGYVMVYPLMWSFPRYMEFQQRAWTEITKSSPEFIVIIDLQTSQLWDGKANLWWYQKMKEEIINNYYLSAVVTIDSPVGKLISVSDTKNLKEIVEKKRFPIYIYRKL